MQQTIEINSNLHLLLQDFLHILNIMSYGILQAITLCCRTHSLQNAQNINCSMSAALISALKILPLLLCHIAINLHINCNLFVKLISTDDDHDEMMIQRFTAKVSDDDNNDNIS